MLRIPDSAAVVLNDTTGAKWVNDALGSGDRREMPESMPRFVPKSSGEYTVELAAQTLVKTRLHEAVVNDLESHARDLGWTVTSEHPIDLVLRRPAGHGGEQCIVEVKTVQAGRAIDAVRAAIGQLLTYRFQLFHAQVRSTITLVAAFSEDIGRSLRKLLSDELGIAVLWLEGHEWRGCGRSERAGFVPGGSR